MLRSSSKIKTFGALLSLAVLPVFCAVSASATEVTRNTKFRVNVSDTLSVSVTTPDTWAVGDIDQFLRNRINVAVTSNNAAGFTATMTTKTNVKDLTNTRSSSYIIPTLQDDATVSAFPANYWGYSLSDERPEPLATATYSPLVSPADAAPITILSSNVPASLDQDVYFGAKANASKASGTYQNTVVISVVTGVIDDSSSDDPVDPDDPTPTPEPAHDTTPDTPTYDPTNDRTTYTVVTPNDDDTTTTTTEISNGDTRSQYADPQGVKHKSTASTTVNEGQPLATGLAVTAAVSAATGFLFFIIAKRRKDDDEEEDENQIQQ